MKSTRRTHRRKIRKSRKARRDIRSRKSYRDNRKDRRTRRARRKVRKGGFFSEGVNQGMFSAWKRNNPMTYDCCPCVFGFLGLPDKEVQDLKAHFDNWKTGLGENDIASVFKEVYPDYDFGFTRSPKLSDPDIKKREEYLNDMIKVMETKIPEGSATVGGIQWCGGPSPAATCGAPGGAWRPRHCFLIGKDSANRLYLADVQAALVYTGTKQIMGWLMNPPGSGAGGGTQTEYLWILNSACRRLPCAADAALLNKPLKVTHPQAQGDDMEID